MTITRYVVLKWNVDLPFLPFIPQQPTVDRIDLGPQQPTIDEIDQRGNQ